MKLFDTIYPRLRQEAENARIRQEAKESTTVEQALPPPPSLEPTVVVQQDPELKNLVHAVSQLVTNQGHSFGRPELSMEALAARLPSYAQDELKRTISFKIGYVKGQ